MKSGRHEHAALFLTTLHKVFRPQGFGSHGFVEGAVRTEIHTKYFNNIKSAIRPEKSVQFETLLWV